MSSRTKKISRSLAYTAVFANDLLTVTTTGSHYLATGDQVALTNGTSTLQRAGLTITVTSATEFTIKGTFPEYLSGSVIIEFFRTGQTGDQGIVGIDKTMSVAGVVQMTAQGTGGAVIVASVSNDGIGWIVLGTVTLAASNLASDFLQIAPMWSFMKLTITSIGAATKVTVTTSL